MPDFLPFKYPIGVDFSDSKIRFFQFKKITGKITATQAFGEIQVPPGIITNGQSRNNSTVGTLLSSLLQNPTYGQIKGRFISASVSEKISFLQQIEIPKVPENELAGAVAWGVEQHIPYPISQVYFDWNVLSESADKLKIIISAAPKATIDSFTQIIKDCHFIPVSFENESIALARCLSHPSRSLDPVMIVDLGKSRSTILIIGNNTVNYTSSIDISGNEMTQSIVNIIKLSFDDAEKAKIIFGLDAKKIKGSIKKALTPIIDRLVEKISESMTYYNEYVTTDKKISRIFLTGSVGRMLGLTDYIEQNIKIPTELADPLTNFSIPKTQEKILKNNDLFSYVTAIGLARKFL